MGLRNTTSTPPRWVRALLRWWADPNTSEEVEGDLLELYNYWVATFGQRSANWKYTLNALKLLRPFAKDKRAHYPRTYLYSPTMIRNYFKIAFRNLLKHKGYSFINVAGLAMGMAVAMLIGLWVWDEVSYNKQFGNYDRIVQVMQHQTFDGQVNTQTANPYLMGDEIRNKYGNDFKYIVMSSWTNGHILAYGDKKLTKTGNYFEPGITEMLSLQMLKGSRAGLNDVNSILLSESAAKAYFGSEDPMGKVMKIDNKNDVKVTGVYKDLPYNSDFKDLTFLLPWSLYLSSQSWIKEMTNPWRSNFTQTYAMLAEHADIDQVSTKIKDVKLHKVRPEERAFKPVVFLHPMRKWHLFSEFKDGVNIGGRIEFVWLFGIIGGFVLLLACINFMNLSTARSEKRAKEVGVRKAVGSVRGQLINQFLSESLLVTFISLGVAILLVHLLLPMFNEVADKKMTVLWNEPLFWLSAMGFTVLTGIIAGSYPAFYLSSFRPVQVLKGTFRVGRFASVPRKVLVTVQFTVSVALMIGTIVVFQQIDFAKKRPAGYAVDKLLFVPISTPDLANKYEVVRNDLLKTGAISEVSESSSPITSVWAINNGYSWKGKDPGIQGNFAAVSATHEFGKTIGWELKEGRDFSRDFPSDSSAMILNETAVKFMGLKKPVGEIVKIDDKVFHVIGVVKDMVMQSPYQPVFRTSFVLDYKDVSIINIKINATTSTSDALAKIETVFRKHNPAAPFEYQFIDEEYAKKFTDEVRIGKLATFFAILAIFISCLGLFGLASFVAEQRTKEIGIRKVLGASVSNLWGLLSKEFVVLVVVACVIAGPITWYGMNNWIQKFDYHTDISWWIFVVTAILAVSIALLTVSYQAIKAALMNPVKSLKSE
ncbi:ABC transporter permease [Runella sp. MFBS21]|uniref:ABC transporter permease n=1 Tax=Runella sp. MFBS21 TaxID=3034018 RepID=UPI0023F7C6C8|nr:ABC transporter permease [Runella sp. MFBS21]MDF7815952.1 ABC transporter permease [Runella sp. MFBS21]